MVIPRVMLQTWGKCQETKIWATHHLSGHIAHLRAILQMVIPRVMLQTWGKCQETKIWATHHLSGHIAHLRPLVSPSGRMGNLAFTFYKRLPSLCRRRDQRPIHPHWAGSAPTSVFPCSGLLSCAYGELDQASGTLWRDVTALTSLQLRPTSTSHNDTCSTTSKHQ